MIRHVSLIAIIVLLLAACANKVATTPGEIHGTIRVADNLSSQVDPNAVLYIMARKQVGPPLAVKRVTQVTFPLSYTLSAANAMVAGTEFEGEVSVTARLDKDGNAGPLQPGDMTGAVPNHIQIGQGEVDIVIDHLVE